MKRNYYDHSRIDAAGRAGFVRTALAIGSNERAGRGAGAGRGGAGNQTMRLVAATGQVCGVISFNGCFLGQQRECKLPGPIAPSAQHQERVTARAALF